MDYYRMNEILKFNEVQSNKFIRSQTRYDKINILLYNFKKCHSYFIDSRF